ncbi:hypothetical protein [Nonomuraea sediminis]|uniref:hypothetical protein n=1 Tax=Nonomuraea sediminis TaxID=2835864 RepID=UPI001BDCB2B1|nr:hypothetical protein [Nonomuraea sediminis]
MSRLGPVITLAAGAVLAAGLGVASVVATPTSNTNEYATTDTTTSAAPPAPTKAKPKTIEKADYAGYVKGNGGLIAVSVRNGKAIGYFCDGKTEAWFKGTEADGKVALAGFGDAKAKATLGGGKAKGWLAVSGHRWDFSAATVVKPSGLYRATAFVRGAKLRAGWIVLAKPRGGFYQVGAAFEGDKQIQITNVNDERPTDPVTLGQTTVYPKDVDGFIQEMQ